MFDTLLAIAIEESVKRANNRKVWEGLSDLNGDFLKPMANAEDAGKRLAKSTVVQDKAVTFVDSFADVWGRETATLYCHLSLDHIPRMVRDTPVDIADLSQQYVEHALKQGKQDMHNFSNLRLIDNTNKKSRNFQVMAKDRERVHLKREAAMPQTRNEKRQLDDGSKKVEKAVDRAGRKGLLISRSNIQIDKRLVKTQPARDALLAGVLEKRRLTSIEGEPGPSATLTSTQHLTGVRAQGVQASQQL